MKRKIELLAPGGDIDSIKAAIAAGADAVYCGLNRFNARNRASNINFEALVGILNLAHKNNCKVFLTLNIIIAGSEMPALTGLLNKLINTGIDGVIIQDFGLFYLLSNYFKDLPIHASTQLTTHNEGQINFLSKLGAKRVNLSRELNIDEIKALTATGHKKNISTEVFVHGSYCISFSGICYLSSVHSGNSGNRGRCSQPCRDRYLTTPEGKNYPLNLKDNSAYFDLETLYNAGVDSLKIEGRIKKSDYVYTVVNSWKKQIGLFYEQNRLNNDNSDLYKVFNRDFSNGYLKGDINKSMFIDNPRDHSITYFSGLTHASADKKQLKKPIDIYDEKAEITRDVKRKIKPLSIAKIPLIISISGKAGEPLNISVKTPEKSFVVVSEIRLANAAENSLNQSPLQDNAKTKKRSDNDLNYTNILKKLGSLNNTEYYIKQLELVNLQNDLFIPFKEFTSLKRRLLSTLTGLKKISDPIKLPFLKKPAELKSRPALGILISSPKELLFCRNTSANIFFQIPDFLKNKVSELTAFFLKNKQLIPWFPSVLIGENYTAAIDFLEQVRPKQIVTNNTGVAYEAFKKGFPWIAGPYLNTINSFSLLCLKENFNCSGAFISNEISKYQIKSIIPPKNFKLYYSIYHPILLLTSRQCLLHQVIGCEKNRMDESCIETCNKSSSITNLTKVSLYIKKTEGNYHCIYNHKNFLNTEIVSDLPGIFSCFSIDLRNIKSETRLETDKAQLIQLFEKLLNENPESEIRLKQMINPSTNSQYRKGI